MSTPELSGDYDEFSSRPDVVKTMAQLEGNLAMLNEKLSYSSPSYDSLVLFSAEAGNPIATPLVALDAYDTMRSRHTFRDNNIMGRRLLIPGTAMGEALKKPNGPFYSQSAINNDYFQITHTEAIKLGKKRVAVAQYSFTAPYPDAPIEHLPGDTDLNELWEEYSDDIHKAAHGVSTLQGLARELHTPLPAELEYEEPIAPNAFLIRWDVEGAKAIAQTARRRRLQTYLNRAHRFLSELAEDYTNIPEKSHSNIREVYDNQGDGAYIVLPIPEHYNTYDRWRREDYRTFTAQRFMNDMQTGLDAINERVAQDTPFKVNVSGDFGYAEADSTGRLDSTTMYALADLQKEK